MVTDISISPELKDILYRGIELGIEQQCIQRFKNCNIENYSLISEYAVSEEYLNKRMQHSDPKIEYSSNVLLSDTTGGKFILDKFKSILYNTKFYTSGYVPKGFVGWHSDTDIAGWYVMFSYSSTGDGLFKFYDKKIITIPDTPGWMCRAMKLGKDPADLIWHCAVSNCVRYTFLIHFDTLLKYRNAIDIIQGNK